MDESVYKSSGFIKSEKGYLLKIHDMTWCEIDDRGFVEIFRKQEFGKANKYHRVTLPHPIRTEKQFNNLMLVLNGK